MVRPTYSNFPTTSSTTTATKAAAVTAADTDLAYITRSIYVGTAGDLVVVMAGDGAEVTFTGIPAGSLLPIAVTQVKAATTASDIVALY